MVTEQPGAENIEAAPELTLTGSDYSTGENSGTVYKTSDSKCGKDGCPLTRAEAEKAWEELFAARTGPGWEPELPTDQGDLAPSQADFDRVLQAVRPPDKHALATISSDWNTLVVTPLRDEVQTPLKTAFAALKEEWKGKDFDEFAKRIEATQDFIQDILDDINATITSLDDYSTTVGLQQTGAPFPAAQVWSKDGGSSSEDRVHIRPPWHSGECHEMGMAEAAEKLVTGMEGADSEFANMQSSWETHYRTCANPSSHLYIYGYYGTYAAYQQSVSNVSCESLPEGEERSYSEAKEYADNHVHQVARLMKDEVYEDYEQNVTDISDDIKERVNSANGDYQGEHPEIDPNKQPPPQTPGEDTGAPNPGMSGVPPMGSPGPGSMPDTPLGSAPSGYNPDTPSGYDPSTSDYSTSDPTTTTPDTYEPDYGSLQSGGGGFSTPGGGGFTTPGGGGGFGTPGGGGLGGGTGSGMTGGGGLVGAGGGAGRGAGAGRGGGRGGMGMMGGAGRGAGGAGKGAAGAGRGGMGMMGGAGRGGAHGNENEEHGTWLQEEDDVWGTDGDDLPPSLLR